ncbi:hypothetical protein HDU76_009940, partial [Blyttiomyces sp. JEL0837]
MEEIQGLLRPTESCVVTSELWILRKNGDKKKRIVAVVESEAKDEACALLLQRNGPNSVVIVNALPIKSDFRWSLSQAKPVVPLDPKKTSGTDFHLKLTSGSKELKLYCSSLQPLEGLLVELKRYMAIA